jgi:uncharacterized protein
MNHLERGKDDWNQFWRYLVNFVSGFAASNFLGAIPIVLVMFYYAFVNKVTLSGLNVSNLSSLGVSHNLNLVLMMIPFFIALYVTIKLFKSLHKRTVSEVINGTNSIRWKRYFIGFGCWFALIAIYQIIDYLFISPSAYAFQFKPAAFFVLVLITILTIPVQVAYEELLFRGYFAQGIGAGTGSRWLALFIPTLLFALVHIFNPEVKEFGFWVAMPQYLTFGLAFGLMTLLDDGVELAMGAHTANNMFLCIFVSSDSSALVTSAMFKQTVPHPVEDAVVLGIIAAIMLIALTIYFKWDLSVLNRKVQIIPEKVDTEIE